MSKRWQMAMGLARRTATATGVRQVVRGRHYYGRWEYYALPSGSRSERFIVEERRRG